mmetsp:Transcript_1176/g.1800  ORF Transcript_1176/g.1800 Transcript_1176/m.1800 type:complete len:261 (-) Transcript_1176:380-1162(-)
MFVRHGPRAKTSPARTSPIPPVVSPSVQVVQPIAIIERDEPLIGVSMSLPESFISCAEGEVFHRPEGVICFLPTSLLFQEGEWNWHVNSYATVYDTPMTDKMMDAARVVLRDKLESKVVLPTNMMVLTDHCYLTEWHRKFLEQFVKFSAIYERWVEVEYGESEDRHKYLAMKKALQNWRDTCDALIVSTNFSTNWSIPAFFPVYNMYCTKACTEYFQKQKKMHAFKEEWWDAYSREALVIIDEWRRMFVSHTSPKLIPFP